MGYKRMVIIIKIRGRWEEVFGKIMPKGIVIIEEQFEMRVYRYDL